MTKKKRGKMLWAGGTTAMVADEIGERDGLKLVTAVNGDGERFVVVLDREGRNIGHADDEVSALDNALRMEHFRFDHEEKTLREWRKELK